MQQSISVLLNRIPLWLRLTLVVGLLIAVAAAAGISVAKSSIYLGLGFLACSLIPIHFRKWVKYRRDTGIVAGILIAAHSSWAFWNIMGGAYPYLFSKGILPGLIAEVIMAVLLITSNLFIQRKLGARWKAIHAFVWLSLPLAMMHTFIAGSGFNGELPLLAMIILGGLTIFSIGKLFLPTANRKEGLRDIALTIAGFILASVIFRFVS